MLDLYRLDEVFGDYEDIRKELSLFSDTLGNKEELIVFSKWDLLDTEMKDHIVSEFSKKYPNQKYFVISAATGEGIEELKDYLVENFVPEVVELTKQEEKEIESHKTYDLREENDDSRHIHVEYLGDLQFKASGKRLEQIVRMTDFENKEAVMRVYDVLEKMWVMRNVEKKLAKVLEEDGKDNSFFFVGSDEDNISPRILIGEKEVPLEKLKFKW